MMIEKGNIDVEIDEYSGFCFGVVTAIKKAEEELAKGGVLYCLGDIVHNGSEVKRLEGLGLRTIDHEQFGELRDAKVLLRAHGEPPLTYETARKNNITLIDATCPVVLMLQRKIRNEYLSIGQNGRIVIFGKRGHAEVNGLVGQTNGEALIIENEEDARNLSCDKDVSLFSQTTKPLDEYRALCSIIENGLDGRHKLKFNDTICRQVANRIPNIRKFASRHDLIIFVSGKKSSNGRILYEECVSANENSRFISSADEFRTEWLAGVRTIGVCGATSTPKWLMYEVAETINNMV